MIVGEIKASEIVEGLVRRGIPAFVEHSGGGCATIYGGESYVDAAGDQRWPVLIGPGAWHAEGGPSFDTAELFVGPDDDGSPDYVEATITVPEGATAVDVVAYAVLVLARRAAPVGWEAVCGRCGETFNPDGPDDLEHLSRLDGAACGGQGKMTGCWS